MDPTPIAETVPVHWMFDGVKVKLVPVGPGYWRFNEDKLGVLDIRWVPKTPKELE